jgi:hypothetical protein
VAVLVTDWFLNIWIVCVSHMYFRAQRIILHLCPCVQSPSVKCSSPLDWNKTTKISRSYNLKYLSQVDWPYTRRSSFIEIHLNIILKSFLSFPKDSAEAFVSHLSYRASFWHSVNHKFLKFDARKAQDNVC